MGNSIKRQLVTAAVTLSLFTLGSVGVSSAGVATVLNGTFKGKDYCATVLGQRLGTEESTKQKDKDDVTILWKFDDFPDIDAVVTNGPLEFIMDGYAVRANSKKGNFDMNGDEVAQILIDFTERELSMNGTYKGEENMFCGLLDASTCPVPTSLKGNFFMNTLTLGNLGDPDAITCVTGTGSFNAKGGGVQVGVFP